MGVSYGEIFICIFIFLLLLLFIFSFILTRVQVAFWQLIQ